MYVCISKYVRVIDVLHTIVFDFAINFPTYINARVSISDLLISFLRKTNERRSSCRSIAVFVKSESV